MPFRLRTNALIFASALLGALSLFFLLPVHVDTIFKRKDAFSTSLNETLGFEKLIYINLPHRMDYDNAMTLQGELTGLRFEALTGDDYHDFRSNLAGLPPIVKPDLAKPIMACALSHMRAWRLMIEEGWQTMMVLEADSTWDANLKPIMFRMAKGLHAYISERQRHRVLTPGPTCNDPWDHKQWDYLTLGACFDHHGYDARKSDRYIIYPDEDSPDVVYEYPGSTSGLHYTLKDERVLREAGFPLCTGSYAVARQGAEKLLLRTSMYLDKPVDVIIADLIDDEDLVTYEPFPPVIYQWDYIKDVGTAVNSEVEPDKSQPVESKTDEENSAAMSRLSAIYRNWNVWQFDQYRFPWPFKNWVMEKYKDTIMTKDHFF